MRPSFVPGVLALLLGLLTAVPSTASAETLQLVIEGGSPRCGDPPMSCDTPADCVPPGAAVDGVICDYVGTDMSTKRCSSYIDSFFCCSDSDDCVVHDGAVMETGTCESVSGGGLSGPGSSVCVFGVDPASPVDGSTFCPPVDIETILHCLQLPGGSGPAPDWRDGDCDGDLVANLDEYVGGCNPCDPSSYPGAPSCPLVDGGVPTGDGGTTDGGPLPDGAVAAAPSFAGGGGCRCALATPSAPPRAGWLGAMIVGGLFVLRARGRRRRGAGAARAPQTQP